MIFLISIFLTGLLALAGWAAWKTAPDEPVSRTSGRPGPRVRVLAGYAALAAVLALLLFRPNEEIETGEDAAAYFHAALALAEQQRLQFPDPALKELTPEERSLFRYGHRGFLLTKDAVLWAQDPEWSRVGSHFLPAYSILLSLPATLGLPHAAFWWSPVLVILTGGLLAKLAFWLTGERRAGWLALALYVFNPAVFWNARSIRAEWPAAYLLLAGLLLWLARDVKGVKVPPGTAFLAGLALAAAGWFHPLSFYVLLPTVLVSLWVTRRTAFWKAWWAGVLLGFGLFLAQVIWLADPYSLKVVWSFPAARNPFLVAGVLVLIVVLGMRRISQRPERRSDSEREKKSRLAGALLGLGYLLAVLLISLYRNDRGMIPGLPEWTGTYHSLTDFKGVLMMFSRAGLGAALAGLVVLGIRPGPGGRLGRRLLIFLGPASLFIGWVDNYMFETRRMVTVLAPLFVLSTTVLLFFIGDRLAGWISRLQPRRNFSRMIGAGLPCLLAAGLLAGAVRGRLQLYTTWNNRSTYRFYRSLAGEAREAGDFLMAEYTQTAAPLERLARLPLLPIAWGYRSEDEYRQAERVLARLVREDPERRYLLVSPFSGAAVPGLAAEPLFNRTMETSRLERTRHSIPERILNRRLTLHIHRLHPPGRGDLSSPYTRMMDRSQLGLAGGANFLPSRTISVRGIHLDGERDGPVVVELSEDRGPGRLFGVVYRPGREPGEPLEIGVLPDPDGPVRQFELGPGWTGLELRPVPGDAPELNLEIRSPRGAYLTDLFWVEDIGERVRRARTAEEKREFQLKEIDSQWLRASASVALPAGPSPRWLWLLAAPEREAEDGVRGSFRERGSTDPGFAFPVEDGWNWHLVPLAPSGSTRFSWYDLEFSPPWDPGIRNFPDDLGIRLHLLTVVTADQ